MADNVPASRNPINSIPFGPLEPASRAAAHRRLWVLRQSDKGRSGAEIAREIGISRARIGQILKKERERRERRKMARERAEARAAVSDWRDLQIRHLELTSRTRDSLLRKFGDAVTLGELAVDLDLVAVVANFGKSNLAELTRIMAVNGVTER